MLALQQPPRFICCNSAQLSPNEKLAVCHGTCTWFPAHWRLHAAVQQAVRVALLFPACCLSSWCSTSCLCYPTVHLHWLQHLYKLCICMVCKIGQLPVPQNTNIPIFTCLPDTGSACNRVQTQPLRTQRHVYICITVTVIGRVSVMVSVLSSLFHVV